MNCKDDKPLRDKKKIQKELLRGVSAEDMAVYELVGVIWLSQKE